MRSLKDILRSFVHALALPAAVWAITSYAHTNGLPEAAASALTPVLETKIFIQSDEHPEFEAAAFDLSGPGKTILKAMNEA